MSLTSIVGRGGETLERNGSIWIYFTGKALRLIDSIKRKLHLRLPHSVRVLSWLSLTQNKNAQPRRSRAGAVRRDLKSVDHMGNNVISAA
jgi:hypothetical protein